MAWMTDEEWEYTQDCKDKKITARSARHKRTHNGKGGAVKFPSDYLTKKELKAMNGPVESYRMNDPMSWDEFKKLPDDLKIVYIKALREKYNVPDSMLAECMGIASPTFCKYMRCYGLGQGKGSGAAGRHWYNTPDHDKFVAWWNGVDSSALKDDEVAEYCENDIAMTEAACEIARQADIEETVEETQSKSVDGCAGETRSIAPMNGHMTFEGDISEILRTVNTLLGGNKVHLKIEWDLLEE